MTTEASVLDQLAEVLAPVLAQKAANRYGVTYKHDQTGGTPSAVQYSHGPQGLLTFPGVDPSVFNATMGGQSLISMIPAMPSLYTNPTYYTVTGVRDVSGDEPDGVCDDAPEAGLMKACLTTSVFGRYSRQTPTLDISRLGQLVDRADPMDLRLINDPMLSSIPFSGGIANPDSPSDVLTNEVSRKFWERNVALHRLLSRQVWSGTPANNTGAGGYKEMTGLDLLINTGYVDAETGTACAAMDSYLSDANHLRIDGNENTVIDMITDAAYQLRDRAERSGIAPVRWVIAMRPQMFYELTAVWPCNYLTYRCAVAGNGDLALDPTDAVRMRDEMRAGKYLLIDGIRYDVVTDDGITEDTNTNNANVPSGCFESDIYFIPMSVVGGRSVLYMEYFQYSNPSVRDALGNMVLGRIEGAWITWPRQSNLCVQWQSMVEPRMVLRTPWLAARVQNVQYCPRQHTRETFPDEPYFVNGGKSHRDGPSFSTLWSD